jgi:hypothetical protein
MKMLKMFLPLGVLAVLAFCGCAVTQDAENDVGRQLEQGLTGQGRLVSPNVSGDSFGPYYQ